MDQRDPSALVTANFIIDHLIQQLGCALKTKQIEELAPKSTKEDYSHTVQSFVFQCFTEKFKTTDPVSCDGDPASPKKDSIATGTLRIEPNPMRSRNSGQFGQSVFGEKSRSIISEIDKKSKKSNFMSGPSSKLNTEKSATKEKKQNPFVSLGIEEEVVDKEQDKLRKRQSDRLISQSKMKQLRKEKEDKDKASMAANEKILNEKSKGGSITYDYEGSFYGVNPVKNQVDNVQKMRQKFGKHQVHGKERSKIENSSIDNSRMAVREGGKSVLSKDKVQFSEKSFSITEALGDISKISEGVKITEIKSKGDSVTLENKAKKLEGIRNYRLKDFKELTKEKSFKEFPKTTPKKHSMFELSKTPLQNKEEDIKSKTIVMERERKAPRSRGVSEHEKRASQTHAVLQGALGRGLPFIRTKGLRFYDIGGNTTNTFLTLDPGSTTRRHSKAKGSRIKIDDSSLFEQTFMT